MNPEAPQIKYGLLLFNQVFGFYLQNRAGSIATPWASRVMATREYHAGPGPQHVEVQCEWILVRHFQEFESMGRHPSLLQGGYSGIFSLFGVPIQNQETCRSIGRDILYSPAIPDFLRS
ncbi:MAG: hypothetical protein LR011_03685 [Verrucomicrobia bacterium]|nr:hypothetical protein [Verrucomicrobiota bacterium]